MTNRKTTLKPLFLMLFFCANASYAKEVSRVEGEHGFKGDKKICRYKPVIEGVSMGWFEGVFTGDKYKYTCYTRNHGEIGEKHNFNNMLIGYGWSTDTGDYTLKQWSPPLKNK